MEVKYSKSELKVLIKRLKKKIGGKNNGRKEKWEVIVYKGTWIKE